MFTGIVAGQGIVESVSRRPGLLSVRIRLPEGQASGLSRGASISINGVCLTVTEHTGTGHSTVVCFDIMQETLERTTLHSLAEGQRVNIERSAKSGAEVGGHILSGHVDCLAEVIAIHHPENNTVMTFKVPGATMKYVFAKGFIALHGCSLTVTTPDRANSTFQIWFIPETLSRTTFGDIHIGDRVNVEIDRSTQVIVDTVESYLAEHLSPLLAQRAKEMSESLVHKETASN